MDTVPWILGIAHPTAFPAYVLLGFAFSHLLPFGSVAFRMSLMSALAMSAAAWFIARAIDEEYGTPWIAAACAWLFAFGSIAWTRGTYAEVHALATCALAAVVYFALQWYRRGRRRDLFAAAVAWGIGLAVHPVLLLALPALTFLLVVRPATVRWRDAISAGGVALLSAAVWYAYLPLRSLYVTAHALDPTRALGLPVGGPFWDYDHPATLSGFVQLTLGGDFVRSVLLSSPGYHLGIAGYTRQALSEMTPLGVAATMIGICAAWVRDARRAAGLLLFGAPCITFALEFPPESEPARYFLPSFIVAAIFIGDAGALFVRLLPRSRTITPLVLAATALVLLAENRWIFALANDENARAVISEVQHRTPSDAVLIASWLDAPPLAYAAYVEHALGGRVVTAAWLGDLAQRVPLWTQRREVFVVGSSAGSVPGYRLVPLARGSALARLVHT